MLYLVHFFKRFFIYFDCCHRLFHLAEDHVEVLVISLHMSQNRQTREGIKLEVTYSELSHLSIMPNRETGNKIPVPRCQNNHASSLKRMVTYEALNGQSQSSRHTKILPLILRIRINVLVAEQKLAKKSGLVSVRMSYITSNKGHSVVPLSRTNTLRCSQAKSM